MASVHRHAEGPPHELKTHLDSLLDEVSKFDKVTLPKLRNASTYWRQGEKSNV